MYGAQAGSPKAGGSSHRTVRRMALALIMSLAAHLALLLGYQPPQPDSVSAPPLELRMETRKPEPPEPQPAPEPAPEPEPEVSQPEPPDNRQTPPPSKPVTTPQPRPPSAQQATASPAHANDPDPALDAATIRRQAMATVRQSQPDRGQPVMPANWTAPVVPSRPDRRDLLAPLFYTGPTGTGDEWRDTDGTYHAQRVLADGTRICVRSQALMPLTSFETRVLTYRSCGHVGGDGGGSHPLEEFHGRTDPIVGHFRELHGDDRTARGGG